MELREVSVIFTVILFISTVGGITDGYIAYAVKFHAFIEVSNSTAKIRNCNGAVITSMFVISTYDCLWDGSKFRVKLGALLLSDSKYSPAYDEITENVPQHYPTQSLDQKYPSLLKMGKEIVFGSYERIRPVLLPPPYNSSSDDGNVPAANYYAIATCYGQEQPEYLKMVVEPSSQCRNDFSEKLLLTTLCVRSEDYDGNDSGSLCGETAAPLVTNSFKPTLIGMFGISDTNCKAGGPNLFIQIDRFVKWINETMEAFLLA